MKILEDYFLQKMKFMYWSIFGFKIYSYWGLYFSQPLGMYRPILLFQPLTDDFVKLNSKMTVFRESGMVGSWSAFKWCLVAYVHFYISYLG